MAGLRSVRFPRRLLPSPCFSLSALALFALGTHDIRGISPRPSAPCSLSGTRSLAVALRCGAGPIGIFALDTPSIFFSISSHALFYGKIVGIGDRFPRWRPPKRTAIPRSHRFPRLPDPLALPCPPIRGRSARILTAALRESRPFGSGLSYIDRTARGFGDTSPDIGTSVIARVNIAETTDG